MQTDPNTIRVSPERVPRGTLMGHVNLCSLATPRNSTVARASTGRVTSALFLNIPYRMLCRAALSVVYSSKGTPGSFRPSSDFFFSGRYSMLSRITIDADISLSPGALISTLGFFPITVPQLSSDTWPSSLRKSLTVFLSECAYYICSCQRIASNACPMACFNG